MMLQEGLELAHARWGVILVRDALGQAFVVREMGIVRSWKGVDLFRGPTGFVEDGRHGPELFWDRQSGSRSVEGSQRSHRER